MITAVIDTNVLASGSVRPEPAPGQLLLAWRERLYTLVVSEHILAELARTFEAPYFQPRLSEVQRANSVALIRDEAIFTSITVNIAGVATHPEDDLVLATAVSANADYLVTGDTQLQKLRTYQGVSISSPRQFLDILAHQMKEEREGK